MKHLRMIRMLESIEEGNRRETDAEEKELAEKQEKLLKEMCAALNEKQRSQLMELVWSIEELYDYIGFRGQAYAFSFGLSIGMETSELLEEDFCWE